MRSLVGRLGRDGLSAIVLLAVAAAGVAEALTFPPRAAAWPLWMWGLLALLSLLLLITALRRGPTAAEDPET